MSGDRCISEERIRWPGSRSADCHGVRCTYEVAGPITVVYGEIVEHMSDAGKSIGRCGSGPVESVPVGHDSQSHDSGNVVHVRRSSFLLRTRASL